MAELLTTQGLTKRFRGLVANENIDFHIDVGEVRCVIGPNGAGKTTFLSMLSGHQSPSAGCITYNGQDITALSVVERARIGIGRKFQTPTVFDNLTVYENIELSVLRVEADSSARTRKIDMVLDAVRLVDLRSTPARELSHGQRQWLEVGLLLGNESRLLLLDEPTAGMTNDETAATGRLIRNLADERGLTIIIIEHDIHFIRDLRSPVTVLHLGKILMEGSFEEVASDPTVRSVYLGADL
ncbi:ATP-binding cassette domain-containing protein [Bradyrhizobium sp. SYSU BS000235]|uniref:ATP-binding cassette domain-containing protein n=1 Tax=Bradyrhizobium sp. SYSU BS000235 TaxID=3411332 RepID=UPI003C7584FD